MKYYETCYSNIRRQQRQLQIKVITNPRTIWPVVIHTHTKQAKKHTYNKRHLFKHRATVEFIVDINSLWSNIHSVQSMRLDVFRVIFLSQFRISSSVTFDKIDILLARPLHKVWRRTSVFRMKNSRVSLYVYKYRNLVGFSIEWIYLSYNGRTEYSETWWYICWLPLKNDGRQTTQ